jgi:uncharacterized protein YdaU (DUF1376 family)
VAKPYMPLMVGDWLKGTRGMRAQAKGVYMGLLLHQHENGFIPSDLEELSLIEPEVKSVWEKIKDKFEEFEKGKLRNNKLQEVLNYWNKQSDNGKKGGRKKKENPKPNPNVNPNNNPDANPEPNHHNDIDYDNELELNLGKGGSGERVILPFSSVEFKVAWYGWKKHLQNEHQKLYNTFSAEQAAVDDLAKISLNEETRALHNIKYSIAKNWKSLHADKDYGKQRQTTREEQRAGVENLGRDSIAKLLGGADS